MITYRGTFTIAYAMLLGIDGYIVGTIGGLCNGSMVRGFSSVVFFHYEGGTITRGLLYSIATSSFGVLFVGLYFSCKRDFFYSVLICGRYFGHVTRE